ncbi:2,5-diamino-6-(ribosylamino)-4(3H)-pyrimidinone 5'-phosphate reductase [Methanogenium organophilum]|uniref:2,5-diamino-6-(ribosylamino)-4(3H)-pyrimidinone 5'-phosphate reductase n=1 Tax=Methanogenium organophilum TaxID=2199 RepID=A0A9X9T7J7_METOG|nr:2,5-diamino-6-(ribosylamino)-4(3H)-pyrimidinone 5'-phosphate reductase [Methanogenium organophilum]WAI00760.1 2,5-diamino-6-(ribosylamino)-4(3H)-pyrimidinone 5'-phosphate reductase [Methanogenium organophilum]
MRPHVFVNLAMSADGKLSTIERRQVRISGDADFRRVDLIKSQSDAIMVGIGTVLADDPSLTVKDATLRKERADDGRDENPVRIVIDSRARTPVDADILHKGPGRRIIVVSNSADPAKTALLSEYADIQVFGDERVDMSAFLEYLGTLGIRSLMVEGGGTLIWSLFAEGLVDELYTCVGNVIIGGADAPTPADGDGFINEADFPSLVLKDAKRIDDGILLCWSVKKKDGGE